MTFAVCGRRYASVPMASMEVTSSIHVEGSGVIPGPVGFTECPVVGGGGGGPKSVGYCGEMIGGLTRFIGGWSGKSCCGGSFMATTGGTSGGGSMQIRREVEGIQFQRRKVAVDGLLDHGNCAGEVELRQGFRWALLRMPVGMGLVPCSPARGGGGADLVAVDLLGDEAHALRGSMDAYHSEADSHRCHEQHQRYADDRFH